MKKTITLSTLIILFLTLGIINMWSSRQKLANENTDFGALLDELNNELAGCNAVAKKINASLDSCLVLAEKKFPPAEVSISEKAKAITKENPNIAKGPEIIIEYVDVIRETSCPETICPKCPKHPICLPEGYRLWLGGLSINTRLGFMGHIGYDWRSEYLFTCGPAIDRHGAFGIHATVLRRF